MKPRTTLLTAAFTIGVNVYAYADDFDLWVQQDQMRTMLEQQLEADRSQREIDRLQEEMNRYNQPTTGPRILAQPYEFIPAPAPLPSTPRLTPRQQLQEMLKERDKLCRENADLCHDIMEAAKTKKH